MQDQHNKLPDLPPIPNKLYFTIGEVGELCLLKPHVLRYWEHEFAQLRPNKRRGNRRYYQRKDILTVRRIRNLLYDQGFTVEGARAKLDGDNQAQSSDPDFLHGKKIIRETISSLERVISELS